LAGFYKAKDKFNKNLTALFPYENTDKDGTYFWLQSSNLNLIDVMPKIPKIPLRSRSTHIGKI
jgi:hypothetical protein